MEKNMNLIESAVLFAVSSHAGQRRKIGTLPYIIHPMEAAAIAASLTEDENVIAATLLHDVVEDCGVLPKDILENFGERVAELVASETENKRPGLPPENTWQIRKQESLDFLEGSTDRGIRILWLSDKLSNMRSFHRTYLKQGDALWSIFHQSDPARQAWYYRSIYRILKPDFEGTAAFIEYERLCETVFKNIPE